jgi:UDP:flavonoid glycosyltransferase YjiC (YdhE family)
MPHLLSNDKFPLIGFFPLFYNLAETGRAVVIAKRYIDIGGEVVFFSHGGDYEYLAQDIGAEVVRVRPIYNKRYIDWLWASSRLESFRNPFSRKILDEHVKQEIAAFNKSHIELIVSTNNFPCYISARAANIPLVTITTKLVSSFSKYPEDAEFFFTRFFPDFVKRSVLNWYAPQSKTYVKSFQKISKKYNVKIPKIDQDIIKGDYTLYVDFIEFLDLPKSALNNNEFFVGVSFFDELLSKYMFKTSNKDNHDIIKHISQPGRSILLSFGSSGKKELFLSILRTLNETDYNVVAIYTTIVEDDGLPKFNDNILLKKFVPSIKEINKMVDLAIISGGKGTIYNAAYSGKPVIGYPMQFEQHLNIETLVKHGMAILMSRRKFSDKKLLYNIRYIFDNYEFYLNNSQKLARKLPAPNGDIVSLRKILEIMKKENLIDKDRNISL